MEDQEQTEEKKPANALYKLWQKLQETFSSTLMKTIVGLVITASGTFLGREFYYNPMIHFELSGRVTLHDYPETGVADATIYVEGKPFEQKTNQDGVFVGALRIRKKTEAVIIHCEKSGYQAEHKTVFIPLEKNPRQRTYFTLKPL